MDVQLGQARLEVQRLRRAVADRLFEAVAARVAVLLLLGAEGEEGVAVGPVDRGPGQAEQDPEVGKALEEAPREDVLLVSRRRRLGRAGGWRRPGGTTRPGVRARCSHAALPCPRVSRLVHDGDDFDPLREDPVEDRERELPHQSAADGRLHGLVQPGRSEIRPKVLSISSSNDASTCGGSSRYHRSGSARSCTAADVSRTGRVTPCRRRAVCGPLPRAPNVPPAGRSPAPSDGHESGPAASRGTGISPGARLSQNSTTSSMRSCAGRLSASLWISDLANIVSAYPLRSTTWRHNPARARGDAFRTYGPAACFFETRSKNENRCPTTSGFLEMNSEWSPPGISM